MISDIVEKHLVFEIIKFAEHFVSFSFIILNADVLPEMFRLLSNITYDKHTNVIWKLITIRGFFK